MRLFYFATSQYTPFVHTSILYYLYVNELRGSSSVLLNVMLALCGLWDLDFFCPIVPPFCVSPNLTNLHAFALEYIEALYPLILMLFTYILH